MTRFIAFYLVIILMMPIQVIAEDVHIFYGRVLDYRPEGNLQRGIPGVIVRVFDSDNRSIFEGVTDGKGEYAFDVPDSCKSITIRHQKVGYLKNPDIWTGEAKGERLLIYMSRRDAGQYYFKEVGAAIAERNSFEFGSSDRGAVAYGLDRKNLGTEWRSLVMLGITSKELDFAREGLVEKIAAEGVIDLGVDAYLDHIEALGIAERIKDLAPEIATNALRRDGFLPPLFFQDGSAELTPESERSLRRALGFAKEMSFKLVVRFFPSPGQAYPSRTSALSRESNFTEVSCYANGPEYFVRFDWRIDACAKTQSNDSSFAVGLGSATLNSRLYSERVATVGELTIASGVRAVIEVDSNEASYSYFGFPDMAQLGLIPTIPDLQP